MEVSRNQRRQGLECRVGVPPVSADNQYCHLHSMWSLTTWKGIPLSHEELGSVFPNDVLQTSFSCLALYVPFILCCCDTHC
jgi:hypothetical protein